MRLTTKWPSSWESPSYEKYQPQIVPGGAAYTFYGARRWPLRDEALIARWANRSKADFPARASDLYAPVVVAGHRSCLPRFDERFRGHSTVCMAQFLRHLHELGVPMNVCAGGFVVRTAGTRSFDCLETQCGRWVLPLAALYMLFSSELAAARVEPRLSLFE